MEKSKVYLIKGSLKDVQSHFNSFENFAELHPLFIKVEKLTSQPLTYRIKEKPFSWLPFTIKYRAEINIKDNRVEYTALGLPFKTVVLSYSFDKEDQLTSLNYNVMIRGMLPGKFILINKMFAAQDEVVHNLEKNLN